MDIHILRNAPVVGTHYRDLDERTFVRSIAGTGPVPASFSWEPDNPHDDHAVKVLAFNGLSAPPLHIGYVPKQFSGAVVLAFRHVVANAIPFQAHVEVSADGKPTLSIMLHDGEE